MKKSLVALISIGVVLVFGLIVFFMGMSYKNEEARLVNAYEAKEKKIEAVHDAMWKTIQQKAGVTKEYSAQFDSIYTNIMSERYQGSSNGLFNWIKESNPEFTADLYKDLQVTIEAQRQQFLGAQKEILDIVRVHNNLLVTIPSKWFLGGCKKLDYQVISSTRSKNVMVTRLDDDVDVFK